MAKSEIEKLFLQEKPVEAVVALKESEPPVYATMISKKTDSTYAHTLRVLSKLEKLGLVAFEEKGRIKLVRLTEAGSSFANSLSNLLDIMEIVDVAVAIENLYEREIKGRLREDINKEHVFNRLEQLAKRLDRLASHRIEDIGQLAKKLLKKIEEIFREVKGLIVG